MYYLIYKITNTINGKTYIGAHQTDNLDDGYMGSGIYLGRAIEKYGIDKFVKEIICTVESPDEMYRKEKELVVLSPTSYNLKNGGDGGFDFINAMEHTRLVDVRPDLVAQLHPTKNSHLDLDKLAFTSHQKATWVCDKGHEWKISVAHRSIGHNCPYCAGKAVCIDNCLATVNPDLARQWHPLKNDKLTPYDVTLKSHRKVWWVCSKGHDWKTSAAERTRFGCPYCNGKKVCPENSLAFKFPDIVKQWHPTLNKLTPSEVTAFSGKRATWLCDECGYVWDTVISARTGQKQGCPMCAGKIVTSDNNFAVKFPELAKEWHLTKNGDSKPTDFLPFSNKRMEWQCLKNEQHIWTARIGDRSTGYGCPYCSGNKIL
jgi:hypothetical protein